MNDSPKGHIIEGTLNANGLRVAIVASRWNDLIVSRLIGGAQDALIRLGARESDLTLIRVPGSFEVPLAAKKAAASGRYDALICVGAVIRGETPHFDYYSLKTDQFIIEFTNRDGGIYHYHKIGRAHV